MTRVVAGSALLLCAHRIRQNEDGLVEDAAHMKTHFLLLLAVCSQWLIANVAPANVVVLAASKDNTLYEDPNGALSNGQGMRFFAGKTANGLIRRGLIAFDLRSEIGRASCRERV